MFGSFNRVCMHVDYAYSIIILHSNILCINAHTCMHHMSTASVPVPKAPTKTVEPDNESDTPSVSVEEAEVIVNHATNTPSGQKVIRAEVHMTSAAVPQETQLDAKPEKKSQASKKQLSEEIAQSKTIADKELSQQPTSTDVKIGVKDVEEMGSKSKQSSQESATKLSQEQKVTSPDGSHSGPDSSMATTVNADGVSGDSTSSETMAQNANTTERNKRLSALKDAWESQDKEDVAYLKIVL